MTVLLAEQPLGMRGGALHVQRDPSPPLLVLHVVVQALRGAPY